MKRGIFLSFLALFLMSGCVSQSTYDIKAKEAEQLSAQVGSLETQVKTLSSEVDDLKKSKDASQDELRKTREASEKQEGALQAKVAELAQRAEKAEQLEKATQTYQDLQKKLEKEIQEGQVKITEMKNRLTMTMVDKILFSSGSAEINKEGKMVLHKVVSILKDVKDKRIEVEGHTDNVRIMNVAIKKRFPSNWELSTARATEVVRYLQEDGIDPKVLSASGFAEYQPVASNDDEKGRGMNRRIEIVLLPLLQ